MDLILLRHGKAEDNHVDGDFSRALVERGREQSRRAAHLLKSTGKLPSVVLTSPLIRARQTADEFCQTAGMPGAVIQSWLACGMTPQTAMGELVAFRDFKRVMIVGHEPDFSELIQWLLGTTVGSIDVKKGSISCLSINPPIQGAVLNYLIPPKQMDEADPV